MALTPRPGQLRGTVTGKDHYHLFLTNVNGDRYFAFIAALDSFCNFTHVELGDLAVFTPIQEVTGKARLRAIEVRIERPAGSGRASLAE